MQKKHHKILQEIFDEPVRSNILWSAIENLLQAIGAEIYEGEGPGFELF